jgi:hypothetical protein
MGYFDYRGTIHIHSEYSHDGRISVGDILRAARKAEIDFLMLTDHSCLDARRQGQEGWHGNVLLVVGQEITPRFNHYLAFGVDLVIMADEEEEMPPQAYIDTVSGSGGMGFIAHPDHEGTQMFHVKHFPWTDWSVSGYTGISIWDFMTDWQSSLTNYPRAVLSFLVPALFLKGPRDVTLARWDRLTQQAKVVGIGELDNHDTPKKVLGVTFSVFHFSRAFRFISTHLLLEQPLTGDASRDIPALLAALEYGRAYIALEYFHPAAGFSFRVADGQHTATMGDTFLLGAGAGLDVALPAQGRVRIIKDGRLFHERIGREVHCTIHDTGVYRVEVYLKKYMKYRPWIFSNPIYVR